MRKFIGIGLLFLTVLSCKKERAKELEGNPDTEFKGVKKDSINPIFAINRLDSVSAINKTTSWFTTNKSFDRLFQVNASLYWGFELKPSGELTPYNMSVSNTFSPSKSYYWNDLGTYIYTDLTGDGLKDLWAYYWKNPWPTNAPGLHLFSEYEKDPKTYDLQVGLVQVRKNVVTDLNNDKVPELVLFSSGYDGPPFPGDAIGIFHVKEKRYQYLREDIGYFHGGATGDINNDGRIDIVAYSGGSMVIPIHPTAYLNQGGSKFVLSNHIFKNFNTSDDNYYTVELFDITKDGKLDLLLGGQNKLLLIPQENGQFNRNSAISLPIESGLELMDIAFFDFNKDGQTDILTMSNKSGYNGYGLRLFHNDNLQFKDMTSAYFDVATGVGTNAWIKWIHLFDYDKDGDLDVVADGLFGDLNGNKGRRIWWKYNEGQFTQTHE
ncbi:MAG: hypothetical protein RI924_494 [Bacteroidota bacterium]|jgi:hypothetical protein